MTHYGGYGLLGILIKALKSCLRDPDALPHPSKNPRQCQEISNLTKAGIDLG